jgi:hypothetical protein
MSLQRTNILALNNAQFTYIMKTVVKNAPINLQFSVNTFTFSVARPEPQEAVSFSLLELVRSKCISFEYCTIQYINQRMGVEAGAASFLFCQEPEPH